MEASPKVAIVHDWLIGGGAEKVVLELHHMFPDAPIYTSYATNEWRQKLDNQVITAWLQYWPFSKLRKFIPFLRAWWFSSLNLNDFDLVISSTGAEAKGINVRHDATHICYMHAPTHYYWSRYEEYMQHPGFGALNWLARIGLKVLIGPMRRWDYKAAQKPHYIVANSSYTQQNIKKYYGRDSVVIHPPVDIEKFKPGTQKERSGFVIAGRQTPYKRFDLAVRACTKLGLPLTVIGDGPEHKKLMKLAGPSITFLGKVDDNTLINTLQTSEAFIFPGVDDFGIAAVEALAAGTPVIAYKDGGATDYITSGKNGFFFYQQNYKSLMATIQDFKQCTLEENSIFETVKNFGTDSFRLTIEKFIRKVVFNERD